MKNFSLKSQLVFFTLRSLIAKSCRKKMQFLVSISSAKCYAEAADIKGHWDEELHGMDYLVYAYLQKGENDLGKNNGIILKLLTRFIR